MSVRQWLGAYQAVVVRNDDPLGAQRVTLKIPQVLGTAASQWASPISASSGTAPPPNAMVTVMFLGGDVNHPVYLYATTISGGSDLTDVDGGSAAGGELPAEIIDGGSA